MKTVFILEDEVIISIFLKKIIERKGFNVLGTSTNGTQALEFIILNKPDIVIIDVSLKGSISGIEVANSIFEQYQPKIIFVTGSDEYILRSVKSKYSYLRKPFDNQDLLDLMMN
jgi:YesN/AraC family two-component response regulator